MTKTISSSNLHRSRRDFQVSDKAKNPNDAIVSATKIKKNAEQFQSSSANHGRVPKQQKAFHAHFHTSSLKKLDPMKAGNCDRSYQLLGSFGNNNSSAKRNYGTTKNARPK